MRIYNYIYIYMHVGRYGGLSYISAGILVPLHVVYNLCPKTGPIGSSSHKAI